MMAKPINLNSVYLDTWTNGKGVYLCRVGDAELQSRIIALWQDRFNSCGELVITIDWGVVSVDELWELEMFEGHLAVLVSLE